MGLKVWLPLNGDLHNQGTSNYAINVFRGTETYDNNGKIGKCFYAHGTNALKILNILPDIYNYSAYSLCAWCYVEAQNTSHSGSGIISAGNWNNQLLNLAMSDWSSDHYTKLRISGSSWSRTYNYNFYKNTWYHIVVCDDGTHTYGYVNGVLIGDTAASFLPTSIEGTDICIGGATYYAGMQFFGKINDVRIYDHCLSAAEVREISQGLVLHYKLDDIYSIATTNQLGNKSDHFSGWGSYGFGGHGQTTIANISPALSGEVGIVINKDSGNYDGEIAVGVSGYNLNKNESITFSAYVKGNGNTIGKTGYIWLYKSNGTNTISTGTSFTFTSEWQRVKHTITWTYDNPGTTSTSCYVRCNRAQNESFYISNCQLESGTMATGFTSTSRETGIIQDSSGYGYNGTINSNPTLSSITSRYQYSMSFDGVDDCIIVPYNTVCPENIFTFNLWFKKDALGSKSYETLFGGPSGFEMDTRSGAATSLSLYMASARSGNRNSVTSLSLGNWYMVTMTRDGTKEKYYINGIFQSEIDAKAMPNGTYRIGAWSSNTGQNFYGLISDFRIYCTALDADAIRQLYELGAKVDNKNNIHAFELNENNQNKITKTGQLRGSEFSEFNGMSFLKYDPNVYIEPDGSCWVRVFHHNNPGAGSFSSSNDFAHSVYIDENRWFNVELANHLDKWEIMIKGKFTATSDEWKLRWIQQYNPMTATYANVAVANVTKITTSGYSSSPASWGGLYFKNGSTYLCANNGTSGNWWGAVGSYSVYQSGIPGWGPTGTITTTGFNDVYLRIDNVTFSDSTAKTTKNNIWTSSRFIEI